MNADGGVRREHFATPRSAEFFDLHSLTAKTGQGVGDFGAVVIKELLDNALDASESAGRPKITLSVIKDEDGGIVVTVTDNGHGVSPELVEQVLDFSVLLSDKAAYRSPTRGQQGNALKTVIGIPVALGATAPAMIESQGLRHSLSASIDPAGEVRPVHVVQDTTPVQGSSVTVTVPDRGVRNLDVGSWARAFALVNPHAEIGVHLADSEGPPEASSYRSTVEDDWRKPVASDSTSPHWYDISSLEGLVFAHINRASRGGRDLPLGEFVRQFSGLTSTRRAKSICAVPELGPIAHLSDFDGRRELIGTLLQAMQSQSRAPKSKALGQVPEDHYRAAFEDWYGVEPGRFWFKRCTVLVGTIPWVVEVAVAETEQPGDMFYAVNYSPTFADPVARLLLEAGDLRSMGVPSFLELLDAYPDGESHRAAAVHLISPVVSFLDQGKSSLAVADMFDLGDEVGKALMSAGKVLRAEKKRRDRSGRSSRPRPSDVGRVFQNHAAFEVIPEAMAHASGGGELPVPGRTLYYSVRPPVNAATGKELDYDYFSQKILVQYQRDHGPLAGLIREARGTLREPHTGKEVPLGTLEVANYRLPDYVFDKILYVEKEGLDQVWEAVQLADRYDMAIASGKGQPVEAIRELFERAEAGDYRLFVLHDADHEGYQIAHTIAEATERMPSHSVEVIDLGLSVANAIAWNLEREPRIRTTALPFWMPPRLSETEREWFEGERLSAKRWACTRVELNALPVPDLVTYVEAGLAAHGADAKIRPPVEVVAEEARHAHELGVRTIISQNLARMFDVDAMTETILRETPEVTVDADDSINEAYDLDRSIWWRNAIQDRIDGRLAERSDQLEQQVVELVGAQMGRRRP